MKWNKKYHMKHKEYTLYGRLLEPKRLRSAWKKVRKNKGAAGVDRTTISMFERQLSQHLDTIRRHLKNKTYSPKAVRRVEIPKPGTKKTRKLGIPTVRDRVVQQATKDVLEPIFEPHFSDHSHGYRPGRSAMDALTEIEELRGEYGWVVDTDISGFFDNIDHELLLDMVNERVSDGSILKLLRGMLTCGVLTEGKLIKPGKGTPQGGVISPLLANIYLNHLDRRLEEEGIPFVRYADDFVIFCNSRKEAERALGFTKKVVEEELHLQLNRRKTHIANLWDDSPQKNFFPKSFKFLGFRISESYMVPTVGAVKSFKDKIRTLTIRSRTTKTSRLIRMINRLVRGWGNYFKGGNVKTRFKRLDGWIRMRLRFSLWRGRCSPRHNRRWRYVVNRKFPTKVLSKMGLFSLMSLLG